MVPPFIKKLPLLETVALIVTLLNLLKWTAWDNGMSMSMASGITFILCILAKLLFEYSRWNRGLLLPARILSIGTLVFGLAGIIGIIFGIVPFDNLFESASEDVARAANDMALVAAVCFALTGIALFRITISNGEHIFLPHVISLIILFTSLLSGIAFVFHQGTFHGEVIDRPMGFSPAIIFFLLSFSILMVNKHKGFMGQITSQHQGGKIARVLIPVAIAIPVILGFFQMESGKLGFSNRPYDVALITLGRIVVLVVFIWGTAAVINRSARALMAEVDERKKDAEIFRYRKALLEAQNEAIPDAISVVDTKGKMLSFNRHFAALWNIPRDVIDNNDDTAGLAFAMMQLKEPEEFIKKVNYVYAHPTEPAHDEILFKDGRIIERHGNQVVGDDGTNYGWAWYFRDVTRTRNYEMAINNFNRDLEIKVEERTTELAKSETRFRLLVENSLDIISLIDFDGRIRYMSPSITRLTGFAMDEMIGRSGFDIIHPDDVEGGKRLRMQLIAKPSIPFNSTFRLLHKNGGYIWIEGTLTNMLENENVSAFVLNYHDITERKKNEETIQRSEMRFRSLIENAHDIISLSDGEGKRFYISPAIERITGYTVEETREMFVFDMVHPDDLDHTKRLRKEFLLQPGVIKPLSFRFVHKNGSSVWMEGTVVNLLNDENVNAVVGNFHDVTERKLSEEKVRIAGERLEMVSKATNDAVWDWDLHTDIIFWNEEIKSMFDYSAEDIATGTEWKVHIHPEDFKRVTKKLVYHVKSRIQNWQDEYRFRCADGTYKYVFNRGFILYENEKPNRIIGAMQDVTQINKLQQSLNEERVMKQKELTNATIEGQEKERTDIGRELHDNINQLLTAVKLYLDVASKQPSMKDEMILRSSQNLSVCMDEIRKLTSALIPPSTNLNTFDDIIQDLLEPVKLATSIKVTYEVKGTKAIVLTNDQQLHVYRIIQEHLNNILKHSKAGHVRISIKPMNNQVEIIINDDGQGFDTTLRRKGIGLKNIQSRAELLGGKMKVVSMPGGGCMLFVNFPLRQTVV